MKLRSLSVAIAAAAAVLVSTVGLAPAYAVAPAVPDFSGFNSGTAGHLTGTINSPGAPEIYVRLSNTGGVSYRHFTLAADSDTFDLATWGYGGVTSVYAYACLTVAQTEGECSTEAVVGSFTPTDSTPTTTWSADTTVGPADDVSVDVTDTGGGLLFGQWTDDNPAPDPARFAIAQTGNTVASVSDGVGTVHVYRCDDQNTDQCVELAGAISPTYQVRSTITATIGAITPVSSASPTTSFDVTTDVTTPRTGTYTVTWHLESAGAPGVPIAGYGATTPSAALANGVAQDIPLDATGLPNGSYLVVGTITVVDADFGTYNAVAMTSGTLTSGGDVTPPVVTSIKASPTKIYPKISNNSTYKSTTKITVTGAGVPEITSVRFYQKTTGKLVRTQTLSASDATHGTTTWNGRWWSSTGTPVPSGTYLIKVRDAAGNVSPTVGQVTVSGYKLVSKTWTHTYTPASTLADKYVGRCSTLRKPSLRGWYNSLGYYANTRCASQTSKDSLVSTLHAVFLPSAAQYTDIHVTAYGGAAKAKPGSKAVIRYLNTDGDWVSEKAISSTMGNHSGYTRSTSSLVFSDHSFAWGLYTGFGYQYDVKSFTVVLHYKVLG